MTYEDIKFFIRAGLGRNEWTLLVYYPDNVDGNPSALQFSGARDDAIASARQRIDRWIRRQRLKAQLALPLNRTRVCRLERGQAAAVNVPAPLPLGRTFHRPHLGEVPITTNRTAANTTVIRSPRRPAPEGSAAQ